VSDFTRGCEFKYKIQPNYIFSLIRFSINLIQTRLIVIPNYAGYSRPYTSTIQTSSRSRVKRPPTRSRSVCSSGAAGPYARPRQPEKFSIFRDVASRGQLAGPSEEVACAKMHAPNYVAKREVLYTRRATEASRSVPTRTDEPSGDDLRLTRKSCSKFEYRYLFSSHSTPTRVRSSSGTTSTVKWHSKQCRGGTA
jgi:hypothetical protein